MKQIVFALLALGCSSQPVPKPLGAELPVYNRSDWGYWYDADKDCQDTRQEVLIAESLVPVTLDTKGCRVLTGKWICPYTGVTIFEPKLIDIDHVVPLEEAYNSGGAEWDRATKVKYRNESQLRAVSISSNRSKGSRGPESWLPPLESARCAYLQTWLELKSLWGLKSDTSENAVIQYMLKICRAGEIPTLPQ